jgi:putative transferase (TIGR04331 family)
MYKKYLILTNLIKKNYNSSFIHITKSTKLFNKFKNNHKKNFYEEIHAYHWDNNKKKNKDITYLCKIYEIYLSKLTTRLNRIHQVNHSKEYWRIVIGVWLFQFISIIFDRWENLKKYRNNKNIYAILAKQNNNFNIFNDYMDFSNNLHTDDWNNFIYQELIRKFTKIKIKSFEIQKKYPKNYNKTLFKRILLQSIFYFPNLFLKKSTLLFFLYPYFKSFYSFILQLLLGQFPRIIFGINIPKFIYNNKIREWIIYEKKQDNFFNILGKLISNNIPLLYLEGYHKSLSIIKKNNWPINPKFVFNSNSFFFDDFFKLWFAEKKYSDIKLITGQHGGSFFLSKFNFFEKHQLKISSLFISWGYKNNNKKILPLFNFKNMNKRISYNKNGKLLYIGYEFSKFTNLINSSYLGPQYLIYLDKQMNLIKNLNQKIISHLSYRLFHTDFGWDTKSRINYFNPLIKFDKNKHLEKSLKESRICVVTLNSTVMLETLNLNFPTIIFLDTKFDQFRNDSKSYLNLLKKAGILYEDPVLAAKKINEIWESVDTWWFSKPTQDAVNVFCNRYSKRSTRPLNVLYKFFYKYK